MPIITFQPMFHAAVRGGHKTQTIRKPRKRPIKPGDNLSLRGWRGKPYRSPQFLLCTHICREIYDIRLYNDRVSYCIAGGESQVNQLTLPDHLDTFARADGFADWETLLYWFSTNHMTLTQQVSFQGTLISWGRTPLPKT